MPLIGGRATAGGHSPARHFVAYTTNFLLLFRYQLKVTWDERPRDDETKITRLTMDTKRCMIFRALNGLVRYDFGIADRQHTFLCRSHSTHSLHCTVFE